MSFGSPKTASKIMAGISRLADIGAPLVGPAGIADGQSFAKPCVGTRNHPICDISATEFGEIGNALAIVIFVNHLPQILDPAREATMLEFLPKDIADGLAMARSREAARKSRLRVQVGEAVFPVLRFWHDGFAMESALTPKLRGLVDVYDGGRHVFQCLIIASSEEHGQIVYEFKRNTAVRDTAPLDYWRDEHAPVGYLPKA
jgi:hypothetical protein